MPPTTHTTERPGANDAPPLLIVDDVTAEGAATAAQLAGEGYPALQERDGDVVLERVRNAVVRLVISELHIPCSEGPCLVAALKKERGRLPRMRVLVHTRRTSEADVAWALDAGADGLVPKGAPAAILLREVRRLDGVERPEARESADVHTARGADDEIRPDVEPMDPVERDEQT